MLTTLANAAEKPESTDHGEIKDLMLKIGAILLPGRVTSTEMKIVSRFREMKFLPCRSLGPLGETKCFRICKDDCYINDDPSLVEAFAKQLTVMGFSYEDITTLHPLFHLLQIDHRYISKSIKTSTKEHGPDLNQELTRRFQQCAYAISW